MPISDVIDATPGGPTANSYATVADGDAYHATLIAPYVTDWTGATTQTKTNALIWATRLLDSMYVWQMWPSLPSIQALQWPRTGLLMRNMWQYVDRTIIPVELNNATCEFARQLITANRAADDPIETQGITAIHAGPIGINYKNSVFPKVVPDAVVHLLPPWWGYPKGRISGIRELIRA